MPSHESQHARMDVGLGTAAPKAIVGMGHNQGPSVKQIEKTLADVELEAEILPPVRPEIVAPLPDRTLVRDFGDTMLKALIVICYDTGIKGERSAEEAIKAGAQIAGKLSFGGRASSSVAHFVAPNLMKQTVDLSKAVKSIPQSLKPPSSSVRKDKRKTKGRRKEDGRFPL